MVYRVCDVLSPYFRDNIKILTSLKKGNSLQMGVESPCLTFFNVSETLIFLSLICMFVTKTPVLSI